MGLKSGKITHSSTGCSQMKKTWFNTGKKREG